MLVEISNEPRDYAWGSRTLIATLQGRRAPGDPEAEVWFGDHPGSPARVEDGSQRTLAEVLAPSRLPFLLKLLAAASPLSIQVHPTVEQAREGFARENAAGFAPDAAERNYRDDNAKPEIVVAVTETFEALSGLRPLAATLRLVDSLGDRGRTLADRLTAGDETTALRDTVAWLLSGDDQPEVDDLIAAAVEASADPRTEFSGEFALVRRLNAAYPGDPGVLVAMLMNHVVLERGEALYNRAGVVHAYLDGLGVEVMAASDNVLRGGLTSKRIDVDELMQVLDATPAPPALLQPSRVAERTDVFEVGVPDFALLRVRSVAHARTTATLAGPAIALVIAGSVEVATADASVALTPGRAALITDDRVSVTGEGLVYIAEPGHSPGSGDSAGRDTPPGVGKASMTR